MDKIRKDLLNWYDINQRSLPWRESPSVPYHVMLSEFMLQQTTVTAVKPYYQHFIELWPNVKSLALAEQDDVMKEWAGLGYYSRARNLHRAAREIDSLGYFPESAKELKTLPGIGEYTSKAIAAIAFDQPELPIDGNVKRILARFHGVNTPINRPNDDLSKVSENWVSTERPGDLAQAFMDLGSQICRPKNPDCENCPLRPGCYAFQNDATSEFPVRAAKPAKKEWTGYAYIIETPAGIAFEKRENGLLGNMLGLPSNFGADPKFDPPFEANWRAAGDITHIFTHIQLKLEIWYVALSRIPKSNRWTYLDQGEQSKTATLWRKALKLYEETEHDENQAH